MIFYLMAQPNNEILISARMEGDGNLGDYFQFLKKDEEFCGLTYNDLMLYAETRGMIDIQD